MVKSNLFKRIITAVVLCPLVIGIIFLGFPYYNLMVLAIGALLAWEWSNMTATSDKSVYAVIYTFAVATAVMLPSLIGLCLAVVLATAVIVFKAKNEKHRFLLALGVPYLAIGVGSMVWLMAGFSAEAILWLLLVVWFVDIGGYVVGKTVGGPKLAKKISPNKTWAGLLGGMLFASIVSGVYAYFIGWNGYYYYALFASGLAVIEQIGDLIESAIKRRVGVKDSGNLIPGHGGVFDRVDGLIFTTPVLLFLLFVFVM